MRGYVHVYTGNGKGKTTAALGLALRASGAGMKVFIGQFIKGQQYSELRTIAHDLKNISVKQYGLGCFIVDKPTIEDREAARKGFDEIRQIIKNGKYDMLILDEINIALYYKLIGLDELITLIKEKPQQLELVITGRYAPEEIIEAADLVTEMKEVKHYYQKGIEARKGIEF
ncbi:MAG: cob(I)yrinic acid a,c-diamide adenosyltransferase [Bacteroidales bacterium]|nr:cob(I)yrinic acid a,c-diamide adenosyltransferase [Bacteroidales bacterium]